MFTREALEKLLNESLKEKNMEKSYSFKLYGESIFNKTSNQYPNIFEESLKAKLYPDFKENNFSKKNNPSADFDKGDAKKEKPFWGEYQKPKYNSKPDFDAGDKKSQDVPLPWGLTPALKGDISNLGETNPFEMLGVDHNPTAEEIQKAFRKKSKELHPDRVQDKDAKQAAERAFQKLGMCVRVLSDNTAREYYIRKLGLRSSYGLGK